MIIHLFNIIIMIDLHNFIFDNLFVLRQIHNEFSRFKDFRKTFFHNHVFQGIYLLACELQFLVDYAFTENSPVPARDQVFAMRVPKQHYQMLAQAFQHYIQFGHVRVIATHRVFRCLTTQNLTPTLSSYKIQH